MKSVSLRFASVALGAVVLSQVSWSQSAQDILDQIPIRVQSSNPSTMNDQPIGFGAAVALDGEVLVVGAPFEDSAVIPGISNTGAVYVYERNGASWVETQKLTSPGEAAFQEFGTAVGVALGDEGEDFLVVGGPGAGGSAYLFTRTSGGSWEFEIELVQDEPQAGDQFGTSVAIDYFEPVNSQNDAKVFVVAVGAPFNRAPAGTGSQEGSVSIFQRAGDPAAWNLTAEFFGDNGDLLGTSLAMASDWIIAGAEGFDGTGFNGGGAGIIQAGNQGPSGEYVYNDGQVLQPSDPEVGAGQDLSVAAEYNPAVIVHAAAIGLPLTDAIDFNAGLVLIFDLGSASSIITESAVVEPTGLGQGAMFGTSVALSGQILAVGAPGVGTDGAVFLYEMGPTIATWNLAGFLTIPSLPPVGACRGGTAVGLSGLTAATGCPSLISYQNEGAFVYYGDAIFTDGFESGNTSDWSDSVP